jgi:hypothetical protein
MIKGRFGDTTRRPYIESRLILKRLKIVADISFCIDTAADTTALLPDDGKRIALNYSNLRGNEKIMGIGGISDFYVEPAILVFADPGKYLYSYSIDLRIAPDNDDLMELPSVLGIDIISKWKINMDFVKNKLTVTIVEADNVIPIIETP